MAQLVKHPTLDLSSGLDLRVMRDQALCLKRKEEKRKREREKRKEKRERKEKKRKGKES